MDENIHKDFLIEAYNEFMNLKKIPSTTILCKNNKKIKTKVLWFYRNSEAFVPLYYGPTKCEKVIDESDYLTKKSAKVLLRYIETRSIDVMKKREDKLSTEYICCALKFFEKYLLESLYKLLSNDVELWLIHINFTIKLDINIKLLFKINSYSIEKIDNRLYNYILNHINININNRLLKDKILKYNNDKYEDIFGIVCADIICYQN